MKIAELKERIGASAEMIISSKLGLQKQGNNYTGQCPHGGHKKNNPIYKWQNNHFHCFDCNTSYDIIDFYRDNSSDWIKELHDLANVEYKPFEFKPIKPLTTKQNKTGIDYLISRGISKETAKEYKVTCDTDWIYFNYCLPDNGGVVKIKQRVTKECANGKDKYTAPTGGQNILYGMHLLKTQKILAICEGEIDALSLRECAKLAEKDKNILCSSIPSGSKSFGWIEICKNWLDSFQGIIIIPDSDKDGIEFLEKASELLQDYNLFKIELPTNDVNEYLKSPDYNPAEIFSLMKPIIPKLNGIKNSTEVGKPKKKKSIATGYLTQDYNDSGYRMGCLSLYTGRRGEGKRQSLDSKVLTTQGWTTIGALKIGDIIVGDNGLPTKVIYMSETVKRDLYRVTTRDKRSTLCDLEHLWNVRDKKGYKTKPLSEIIKNYKRKPRIDKRDGIYRISHRYKIPMPKPVVFKEKELPLNPYLIGLLIGDGSMGNKFGISRLHFGKKDGEFYRKILEKDYKISDTKYDKRNYNCARFGINGISKEIVKLGLNVNCYNKSIPECYKWASIEQRIELLRGLMDTDGTVSGNRNSNNLSFSTVSEKLADDFVFLIRSLGGSANKLIKKLSFNINIKLKINPFKIPRKAKLFRETKRDGNAIIDIKLEKSDLGRCIQVDNENGLYITDDFLVTHNTTYSRQGLISIAKQREKCFMFCGETTIESEKNKLARLCAESNQISTSMNIGGRSEYHANDEALNSFNKQYGEYILLSDCETMKEAFPELKKSSKMLFDNLLSEMKKLARSFNVRVFILDNLMVFCNNMGQGKFAMQENIAASLKAFVNEFNVHCCLIAHPKSGDGYQKISGAQEIENIADSIFRYVRLDEDTRNKLAKKLPSHTRERISAMLLTEKVRDDGSSIISFLEWDSKRGAVYDLSMMHQSENYEKAGFWTRKISQYASEDRAGSY